MRTITTWLLVLILVALGGCTTYEPPPDGPASHEPLFGEDLAVDLLEGDIVLRAGIGPDSDLIRELTGSPWSHSGIIVKIGNDIFVVDNYPTRPVSSIALITITEFFSHATSGGVWRYTPNRIVPAAASAWALAQVGTPYQFDLIDMYTNNNRVQYCSEFVWRAYMQGGDNLVPVPLDLKGANLEATRKAVKDFAKANASYFEAKFVGKKVDEVLDQHDGKFIAPGQLDAAPQTDKIK